MWWSLSLSLSVCVFFTVTFPIRSMLFCSLIFTKRSYLNAMYAFIFGFGKFFTRSGYLFSIFFPFMWFILYPNSIHVNNAIKTIVLCCCYFFFFSPFDPLVELPFNVWSKWSMIKSDVIWSGTIHGVMCICAVQKRFFRWWWYKPNINNDIAMSQKPKSIS